MSEVKTGLHLFVDVCKKSAWRIITPAFPYARDSLVKLGILHHEGRQRYLLGWISRGRTIEGLIEHLARKGFANHFVAWVDTDESVSLRKLTNFHWQYHLRVYTDGEIRGHYELTPEAHPIAHFKEIGMEPRREEFLEFLGDWLEELKEEEIIYMRKPASHRAPAASRGVPVNG